MTLQQILEEVKNGQLSVEHAENLLKKEGYEEMDYAKLDTTRKERTGFAEVVYCARKADEHLLNIYQKIYLISLSFLRMIPLKCLEQGRPGISMNW